MKQFLEGIKNNNQTYYRMQSREDHKELAEYIKLNQDLNIDIEIYKKELHIDDSEVIESTSEEQSPY